jgi:formylglycine-generating enzyme required for sulfatase activity
MSQLPNDGPRREGDSTRPATGTALPEDLEDRAYEILLGDEPAARDAAFARLLAEAPAHRVALLRLQRSLRGAEHALADTGLAEAPPPREIGPYRLLRKLGEGGFGVVWLAEQAPPLQRQVAIKLIRPGMNTGNVLRRFEAEREVLARFDHPCIAKVLDAGATDAGEPYLVTEYVAGEPLVAFAQRRRLSLRERVALLGKVADGVQHAHQRGVIHRDLKPSNVLVVEIDGALWPKIIDFGIARALTDDAPVGERTRAGSLLGTPEYMSPEQALGTADVDVRTDVHALGVMLFELLVGDLPLGRERWRRASLTEIVEWIRSAEPPRPSTAVAEPRSSRAMRGDLDTIVLTALAKDRDHRYASVQQFAADLDAFLAHRPIAAGAPGLGYWLRKYVRRHRTQVAAAATVLVALVVGLGTSLVAARRARAAEADAERLAADLRGVVTQYEALADVVRARELREQFEELWPARPERAHGFRTWLQRAEALVAGGAARAGSLAAVQQRAAAGDAAARFLADALVGLEQDVERLAQHGGLRDKAQRGLEWAAAVGEQSLVAAAAAWQEVAAAIAASPHYGGLQLRPQLGLVPLGADPVTGLHEFWHVQSGARPLPGPDGRHVWTEGTGIVLVLLPGGRVRVGAQSRDPDAPHYDPHQPGGDVHEVTLRPFLLAKFELTQAQWQRGMMDSKPFFALGTECGQGPITALHPAENVRWTEASALATRYDLELPTDVQWEYACRGGTGTVWHSGDGVESLRDFANVAGRELERMATGRDISREHADGYGLHAPTGTFRPNGFGLYDMHGNVAELCADSLQALTAVPRDGDGRREPFDGRAVSARGGSFADAAHRARSAAKSSVSMDDHVAQVGVRLARALRD